MKNAIQELNVRGLEFDNEFFPLELFEDGHLEIGGQEVKIEENINKELFKRLSKDEQIQVTCRNKELFFVCTFASAASNPHIFIGWSARLFSMLSREAVEDYRNMLRSISIAVNASYVVFVEEPPDYFEDHFVDVDGNRYLDIFLPSGGKHSVLELWSREADKIYPEGIELIPHKTFNDGFHAFNVA